MGTSRALGYGLIGLGVILGGFLILSMVVTAAAGDLLVGGALLWLLLALIVAVPLIGAGYFVLQRSKQEQADEAEFVGRRRVLDQDRLFRARIASEARQQAERLVSLAGNEPRLARAAARLRQVADQLESPGYDQAAWYDAVRLADTDIAALNQYDTLATERLRRIAARADALELREGGSASEDAEDAGEILRLVQAWERDLDQRLELLRGERAPSVAPSALLGAGAPARGADAIAALGLGDAVSYELDDYLVEVTVSYFASGRSWKLHRLGSGSQQRWLYVGPGGLSLAMLESADPAGADGSDEVRLADTVYRLRERGEAGVSVESTVSAAQELTVDYHHYAAPSGELYWLEGWPDGLRAYCGAPIRPPALEIWPRERSAPA